MRDKDGEVVCEVFPIDRVKMAHFDAVHGIKPTYRRLEVGRRSYGSDPYREIVWWNLRREQPLDEVLTLYLKDVNSNEVMLNKATISAMVPKEGRDRFRDAMVLRELGDVLFGGQIAKYLVREPLAQEITQIMLLD